MLEILIITKTKKERGSDSGSADQKHTFGISTTHPYPFRPRAIMELIRYTKGSADDPAGELQTGILLAGILGIVQVGKGTPHETHPAQELPGRFGILCSLGGTGRRGDGILVAGDIAEVGGSIVDDGVFLVHVEVGSDVGSALVGILAESLHSGANKDGVGLAGGDFGTGRVLVGGHGGEVLAGVVRGSWGGVGGEVGGDPTAERHG